MYMTSIGVIGNGFVGQATALFENPETKLLIFDIDPKKCKPEGTTLKDMAACDLVFICVPTPSHEDGKCNTSIVELVVRQLKEINENCNIVIRSTVPVGTTESVKCFHMPEFLTEKHWRNDFINCELWVTGHSEMEESRVEKFRNLFKELLEKAHKYGKIKHTDFVLVKSDESELIKYFRNTFLSTKIAYCNEFYRLCNALNLNYNTISEIACADKRIGLSHIKVPGHDGKFGFGGTCFPKDTNSLITMYKENNIEAAVLNGVMKRNIEVDRPEQDWKEDPRAFTKKD